MKPKQKMEGSSPEAKQPLTPRKYKQSLDRTKFKFESPPEAPVFSPTLEEFNNPLKYINKIRPIGQKTGICKIIPPAGWKVPFALDMDKLKFTPRIQRINELEARTRIKLNFIDQLTKFYALKGKTFQIPIIEKRALDLYTLHKLVKEHGGVDDVNRNKKWNDVALSMDLTSPKTPALLKTTYDHLILPFITSRLESDRKKEAGESDGIDEKTGEPVPSFRELKSLTFLGPGPKMAVCDLAFKSVKSRTRGKKIMYEFDPLAKYMCKSCSNGEIEESLVTCINCDDRYHSSCLIPPLSEANMIGWRCPKCVATEACKSLEEFGFAQAEREYTLSEFKQMADSFKVNYFKIAKPSDVSTKAVESEFWRIVSSIEESVTVEYGADLHVIDHGSGFPMKNKPPETPIDQELFKKYAESGWNLNNLPVLKASVLCHISADISGMKIPWMYAGMCFATFCWHNEDHWSYSINYLHLGEPKTWYGVPGSSAEDFEKAMKAEAPELFDSQPDILHHLVTIMNPNDIMKKGVPIYRTDQKEGEFVITFPRAYHAGFNQGFNFAEACNFAPYDWLHFGRECINHYSSLKRFCVFSHDELVCKMAEIYNELDKKILLATYKDLRTMMQHEHHKRRLLLVRGIRNASRIKFDTIPDDERQCYACKTTCFLSAVMCKCSPSKLVCLEHVDHLCLCPPSNYKLKYHYKIDELIGILYVMRNKVQHFENWNQIGLSKSYSDPNKKLYFRIFTELLIDSSKKDCAKEDILKVLENEVKNCLTVSTKARTYMKSVVNTSDWSKVENKSTVKELNEIVEQMKSPPCSTLTESKGVTKLSALAQKVQKVAIKLLKAPIPKRSRIERHINVIKALKIEFEELRHLELKLEECEWLEKCCNVLSKPCFSEDILSLKELGKKFGNSRMVIKQRKELEEVLITSQSWADKMKTVYETPYLTLSEIEAIAEEGLKLKCVNAEDREKLCATVKDAKEINSRIEAVISGEMILYYQELLALVEKGKKLPVKMKSVNRLSECIIEVNRWLALSKRLFLKRSSNLDLMYVLWPRKTVPRNMYYNRPQNCSFRMLEGIIEENDKKFTKEDYLKAFKVQVLSMFDLRINNIRNYDKPDLTCPCGVVLAGKGNFIDCEVCCTRFHSKCFLSEGTVIKLYSFYKKEVCSFCLRTNRPQFDKIKELVTEAGKLSIKIPECLALEYNVQKINAWLRKARSILAGREISSALEIISDNSKKIARQISLRQPKSAQTSSLVPEISEALFKQIVNDMKDFCHLEFPLEKLHGMKTLLLFGNILEVATREHVNMWMLIKAFELNWNFPAKKNLSINVNIDAEPTKSKTQLIKKGSRKLRKMPNIKRIMRRINVNSLSEITTTLKAPPPLKITATTKASTDPPEDVDLPDYEHEEGDECAALRCLKPIEDSLDWVQCDGKCGQWFHMKCVDLDRREIEEDDEFICLACVESPCIVSNNNFSESDPLAPSDPLSLEDPVEDPLRDPLSLEEPFRSTGKSLFTSI